MKICVPAMGDRGLRAFQAGLLHEATDKAACVMHKQ